jgi:hypothetical protein
MISGATADSNKARRFYERHRQEILSAQKRQRDEKKKLQRTEMLTTLMSSTDDPSIRAKLGEILARDDLG